MTKDSAVQIGEDKPLELMGYLHAAYVVILSNTFDSLHSLMVVNLIPADSKSNCFEHYNRDC